jgi:hypothetical protein
MEIETMSAKVLPALIVGLLLGTTTLASAVERGVPSYYWTDPYYGTPFENVAPYTAYGQPDPYRGTAFDNVAPY